MIKQPTYDHAGVVLEVTDGDTLVILMDRGFDDSSKKTFRLYGINCPEKKDDLPGWVAARAFTERHVPVGTQIYFRTYKQRETKPLPGNTNAREKYGRFLAEIHTPAGEILNKLLVDSGHAVVNYYN